MRTCDIMRPSFTVNVMCLYGSLQLFMRYAPSYTITFNHPLSIQDNELKVIKYFGDGKRIIFMVLVELARKNSSMNGH